MSRTIKKKLVNISVQHEPFFGRGRKEIGEKRERERERETGRCGNEGRVSREQNSWTVSKQKKVLASAFEAQQQSLSPFSRDEDHKSNLPPAKSKRFDRFMNQVAAATEEESVSLPRLSSIRQATCYVIFWGVPFSPATNMGWRPPDWVTATRKKKEIGMLSALGVLPSVVVGGLRF